MLRYCKCPDPVIAADPRKSNSCCRCGFNIDPEVKAERRIGWFFDRLAAAFPGGAPPESFGVFRQQCEDRERAGRETFGLQYLGRDNPQEAMEEAADGANYFFFDVLQNRQRRPDEDEDRDLALVLTGAWHAFKLHQAAQELTRKRRGHP